jgi:exopolysaccharide production protein ExoZ
MWRAGAAILVLLYHMATIPEFRSSATKPTFDALALFEAIGVAGVDLFFVISGVVMTVTCFERLGDRRAIVPFLKRRVARIYPLYWAVAAMVLALSWYAPNLAARSKTDSINILKSLVLWPQRDYPIVGVGWTLTYEMFFYLTFALLLLLPRRVFPAALALGAVSILALFPVYDDPSIRGIRGNLSLPLFASPLVVEFLFGCGVGWLRMHGTMPMPKFAFWVGIGWLFALGGYFGTTNFAEAAYGAWRLLIFGVPSALIVYGAMALELRTRLWISPLLVSCGDASYSLYLTHAYVLQVLAAISRRWAPAPSKAEKLLIIISGLVACGLVSAACYRWIERPLTDSFRRLIGTDRRRLVSNAPTSLIEATYR